MKAGKLSLVAAASLAICAAAPVEAIAGPIDVGSMRLVGRQNHGPLGGGEFIWQISGDGYGLTFNPVGLGAHGVAGNRFLSFCVETSETISSGTNYDADLNTESVLTGVPLHAKTAWLYSQFIKGTLAGYDYSDSTTLGRSGSGAALQAAIWDFQGQSYSSGGLGSGAGSIAELRDAFKALADAASPSDIGNVRILNIWVFNSSRESPNQRQDMLVMIPLPAPVWMAGIGLCGVVGFCIRRRSVRRDSLEPLDL